MVYRHDGIERWVNTNNISTNSIAGTSGSFTGNLSCNSIGVATSVTAVTGNFSGNISCNSLSAVTSVKGGTVQATGLLLGSVASIGTASDHTKFETDGTMVFVGSATVWNDIITPGGMLYPDAVANIPDKIDYVTASTKIWGFDGGATLERLYGNVEIPHDWKEGTSMIPHVHWTPTSNASGTSVVWQMYQTVSSMGASTVSATLSSLVTPALTGADIWKTIRNDFPDLDLTGHSIGDIISFNFFRDPGHTGDTYEFDAGFLSLGWHYQSDTAGSRLITSKG